MTGPIIILNGASSSGKNPIPIASVAPNPILSHRLPSAAPPPVDNLPLPRDNRPHENDTPASTCADADGRGAGLQRREDARTDYYHRHAE
jgi:hypothetical protein